MCDEGGPMKKETDLQSLVQKTLTDWDDVIEEKRLLIPQQREHGREIVRTLEQAERRLGKNLENYKRALRAG
jgi:hypothetical protein